MLYLLNDGRCSSSVHGKVSASVLEGQLKTTVSLPRLQKTSVAKDS
jgi:hypothetical protein